MSTRNNPPLSLLTTCIPASGLPVGVLSWLLSVCFPQLTNSSASRNRAHSLLMVQLKLALCLQNHSHQMMILLLLCMSIFEREGDGGRERLPSYM